MDWKAGGSEWHEVNCGAGGLGMAYESKLVDLHEDKAYKAYQETRTHSPLLTFEKPVPHIVATSA